MESIVYFITFLAPAHFSHGPDEHGPGSEYRHVGLPLLPVICAPFTAVKTISKLRLPTEPVQPGGNWMNVYM